MLSRVGTPLLRWSWHLIHFRGTICGSVPLGVQGTCQKMTSIRVIAVTFRRKVWEELFVSQLIWYLLGVEINWNSADRTKFWHPLGLLFFNKFRRSGPPSIIFFFISTATELYWMHFIISLGDGHLTGGHVVLNECYLANTRWIPSERLGCWAILNCSQSSQGLRWRRNYNSGRRAGIHIKVTRCSSENLKGTPFKRYQNRVSWAWIESIFTS